MTKKMRESRDLEAHAAKIQIQLAPSAKVTHNVRLKGRQTGRRRQIDVLVKERIGHGPYVLDFTDRTMHEWFAEAFSFNIYQPRFQQEGLSKGKTFRGFVAVAEPRFVAIVLRALWDYRCRVGLADPDPNEEARLKDWLDTFTAELEQCSIPNLDDAIIDFSGDTTLAKLRASIAADLTAEKPDVALDRIHTYCVKLLRHILQERGKPFDASIPLPAIFGGYTGLLRQTGEVSPFAYPALSFQHKLFEALNTARNQRSLAHDNELLPHSEAQYLIDSILAALAFVERIEAARVAALLKLGDDAIPF